MAIVWISKYALTCGIFSVEADVDEECGMAVVRTHNCTSYYHGGEWSRTLDEARQRAEDMRVKKIASVKKQLAKLERMHF